MLRSMFCCSCCWWCCDESKSYTALSPSSLDGPPSTSTSPSLGPIKPSSKKKNRPTKNGYHAPISTNASTSNGMDSNHFEIEIDDHEPDEDEDTLFIRGETGATGLDVEHDLDELHMLDGHATHTHTSELELSSYRTSSSLKNGTTRPIRQASPKPLHPPPPTVTTSSSPTLADLEVAEVDPDLARFRDALERTDRRSKEAKDRASTAVVSPSTSSASATRNARDAPIAAAAVSSPSSRPTDITLPARSSLSSSSIQLHSTGHSLTPSSAIPTVPKVHRRKGSTLTSQSMPTTPFDSTYPQAPKLTLLHPPPAAATSENTQAAATADIIPAPSSPKSTSKSVTFDIPSPSSQATKHFQPSAAQIQHDATIHNNAIQSHATSHPLVHSPSAPPLQSAASIQSFPTTPEATPTSAPVPALSSSPSSSATPSTAPTASLASDGVTVGPKAGSPAKAKVRDPNSNPLDQLGVPSGSISVGHMESIMAILKSTSVTDVSYGHLFAFLDSKSRQVTGKVVRPFLLPGLEAIIADAKLAKSHAHLKRSASVELSKAGSAAASGAKSTLSPEACALMLQFLNWLVDVKIDATSTPHSLTLRFDFDGNGKMAKQYEYIDMPVQDTWVLQSKHRSDPFLFHPHNQPKIYRNDSHRLCIHRELVMSIGPKGVISLRSGDVSIKKFVSFNADLRVEHQPDRMEYDNANNPYLLMDPNNPDKPIIRNNHYVARTFDWWLVVTVLGMENWIGLPHIGEEAIRKAAQPSDK